MFIAIVNVTVMNEIKQNDKINQHFGQYFIIFINKKFIY